MTTTSTDEKAALPDRDSGSQGRTAKRVALRVGRFLAAGRSTIDAGQAAVEALDAATTDDRPGSPGIGGMAVRTDLNRNGLCCRAQAMAFAAARADDVEDMCLGVVHQTSFLVGYRSPTWIRRYEILAVASERSPGCSDPAAFAPVLVD